MLLLPVKGQIKGGKKRAEKKAPSIAMGSRPESPTTPSSPKVLLNKYELGRLLGCGTFAKVYHARSLEDGLGVAIKVIDKSRIVNATMETLIMREVSAMRRLNHPNIVRLHEEAVARRYFQQLVSALHFCHSNGVAHRDVKLENLLLDQEGNLKVSDFGLSALTEQLKDGLLHTACGTPAYTAPEVIRRKGYDGTKADAWSCGIILFVLLAGFLPFDDANIAMMYRKIQRKELEFPPWFSRPIRWIISRLLDPNPDTRITIEALMQVGWLKKSFTSTPHGDLNLSTQNNHFNICMTPRDGKLDSSMAAPVMNAFDIISLSSGLDLSGLFKGGKKREKRFTSVTAAANILERVEEIGEKLGFRVEERKGGTIGLLRGEVALLVKVSMVAPSLFLMEVKVISSDGDFNLYWEEMRAGLQDLVSVWYDDGPEIAEK
ncbi:CBL-interacting serine/threonine-protein kinase 7-like protein [Cinnamomum micranthum f. kanehirae]|uniref:non-specific serine/threonine protein kinase n=1 Tax=Cinnamomum micranthum f. kanehirae TaxID=337451 RepID=A0A3S3NBD5_9MAGN|nr:CBL-interacting serine/threonine-protein kinase 7-like protein [Cinnamomum micranthum f. kanehirae]